MKEFHLEPGEHVISEVRKHWFIFVMELFPFFVLAFLPFLLPTILSWAGPAFATFQNAVSLTSPLAHALLGAWLLLMWCGAFNRFTDYFLDAWIITNTRIVDINQKAFFYRSVSSLLLNRVQDVTVTSRGILVSLLNIGDINVQTAGAVGRFCMLGVPDPAKLRDLILKYVPDNDSQTAPETPAVS